MRRLVMARESRQCRSTATFRTTTGCSTGPWTMRTEVHPTRYAARSDVRRALAGALRTSQDALHRHHPPAEHAGMSGSWHLLDRGLPLDDALELYQSLVAFTIGFSVLGSSVIGTRWTGVERPA